MTEEKNIDSEQAKKPFLGMAMNATREILAVIVGILLALAISDWWEEREINDRTRLLTDKLYIEISDNYDLVKASHAHHDAHLKTLIAFDEESPDPTESEYEKTYLSLYRKSIFRPARVTEINWELAKFTGLMSYMKLEDLQSFAKVFAVQTLYQKRWERLGQGQSIVDAQSKSYENQIRFIFGSMNEIWWMERTLLQEMEAALANRKSG